MRLLTALLPDGTTTAAYEDGARWRRLPAADVGHLLSDPRWRDAIDGAEEIVPSGSRRLTPVPAPSKIICIGLNYREHILEMGRELPSHPTVFLKHADTLIGPEDDIHVSDAPDRVDWEGELVVVVGADLRRATREEAASAIAGYTVANDISMRDWQNRTTQWQQGKMFDATTPVGPIVVTADEFDPAAGGRHLRTTVNDDVLQDHDVSDLVFGPADLLAYVSAFTRLRPGDLVLTGTPGGVGSGRTPPRFLADGDRLTTSIDGIGSLDNRVVTTAEGTSHGTR